MKNLVTNWKTTSAGLLAIIGAVTGLFFAPITPVTISAASTAILAGLGLLLASDSSKPPTTPQS